MTTVVAVGRFGTATANGNGGGGGGGGGDAEGGGGGGREENDAQIIAREKEEEQGPLIGLVPPEILYIMLALLDAKTLMTIIPQVCMLWRNVCQGLGGVHLDFTWFGMKMVPLEVLAGWRLQLQHLQMHSRPTVCW